MNITSAKYTSDDTQKGIKLVVDENTMFVPLDPANRHYAEILRQVAAWYIGNVAKEIKRIDILVNRTREDYATRGETRDDMHRVMDALHRVEDKLDKALGRGS